MSDMKVVPVLVTEVSCLTELPLTMNIRKYPAAKCKFSGELCNTNVQKPNANIVCTNIYYLPQKGQVIGYTLLFIFPSMQIHSPQV